MILDLEVVSYLDKISPSSEGFHQLVQHFIESLLEWQVEFESLEPSQHAHALHTLHGRCGSMGALALASVLDRIRTAESSITPALHNEITSLIRQTVVEYRNILSHR
jgi:HPt (histidine-containing phosphotransfer) domain-containing protein